MTAPKITAGEYALLTRAEAAEYEVKCLQLRNEQLRQRIKVLEQQLTTQASA